MKYNFTKLIEYCNQSNIPISDKQILQFERYYDLLIEWNNKINLTAITDFEDVLVKHFIDSISIIEYYDLSKCNKIIDIGTGAGFPGIPIKILFPNCKITLLDSLNKRIKFINIVKEELMLNDIELLHGRAEDYAHNINYRNQYDLCVSRAVANLSTLTELCIPFVKINGSFISYKSEKAYEEIELAKKALHLLNCQCRDTKEFILNGEMKRVFVIINKESNTPKIYPRKAGTPAKNPL